MQKYEKNITPVAQTEKSIPKTENAVNIGIHSPLGIYANFSAIVDTVGKATNLPLSTLVDKESILTAKRVINRAKAYKLKYASAEIVNELKSYSKDVYGHCRLWHCGRTPKQKTNYVDLVKGEKGKVYFSGLQHCASCWGCPLCVYKIEEQRTNDVYDSLMEWRSLGYQVNMVTLTFPHYKEERLKTNLKFLTDSFDEVKTNRSIRKYFNAFLRSLEIKYGSNGFHPHLHIIVITKKEESKAYFDTFEQLWCDRLTKANKKVVKEYAFNHVIWDEKLDTLKDYICKWNLGDELIKGNRKNGKSTTYTPFQILELCADDKPFDSNVYTLKTPKEVFKEYMTDIKGKQGLAASRNFWLVKNLKTDKEICTDDAIDELIYQIGIDKFLLLGKTNSIHTAISVYELYGLERMINFINTIC